MKFTTAAVVLMAGVAGLLSSCKQEQSSYTMDSLQGTTTIMGVVKYNPGYQETEDGAILLDGAYIPAPEVTVNVSVPYSSLGISGSGSKMYTVQTNEQGYYELQLPMSASATSLQDINVTVESFHATYNLYVQDMQETNIDVIPLENTLFNAVAKKTVDATRNNINKVEDILCDAEYDKEQEYASMATITGEVTYYPGYWIDPQTQRPARSEDKAAVGANVTVTIDYAGQSMNYTAIVNNSGNYELQVPVKVGDQTVSATVSVDTYVAPYNSFTLVAGDYEIVEEPFHSYYYYANDYDSEPSYVNNVTLVRGGEVSADFELQSRR